MRRGISEPRLQVPLHDDGGLIGYVDMLFDRHGVVGEADGRIKYLMGDAFTVADAYMFTVVNWSRFHKFDMATWPNLAAYMERVRARPKVQEAMKAEGLIK